MACLFLSVATAIDYVGIRNAAVWCLHESKKIEICMSHKVTVVGGYNRPNLKHFKLTNDENRREKNEKQHGEKRTKHEMGVCTIVLSC